MANLGPTSQRLTHPLAHMAPRELQQGRPRGSGSSHAKRGGYTHRDAQPAPLLPEAWASATSPPRPTQSRNYTSLSSFVTPATPQELSHCHWPGATKPDRVDTGHSYRGRTSSWADAVGRSRPWAGRPCTEGPSLRPTQEGARGPVHLLQSQEGNKFSLQPPARKVSGGSWKIHYLAERWCGSCGWSPQVALSADASLSPSYNWAPLQSPSCQAPPALSRVSEVRGVALAVGPAFLGQERLT